MSSESGKPVTEESSLHPKLIFTSDFSDVKDTILDISYSATPCRYRLVDMKAFLNDHRLSVYEFADFPNTRGAYYSAISYVWRGNHLVLDPSSPSYWTEELGTFSVKGAEDGDPISLDVLYHVCTAILSCSYSGNYLWLDRLCILQTDPEDKAWQIRQMYSIYRYCKICCILPGGIQRLVRLEEETAWIERAWTLQEALIPHRTLVLFMTDDEQLESLKGAVMETTIYCKFVDVIPGFSAYGELRPLLELSLSTPTIDCSPIRIFGSKSAPIAALFGAAIKQNTHSYIEKDLKEQMIWRCALMRTSSRPVDMVFSIMGLFSVTLDPREFGKNDRVKATIALTSQILACLGANASWLAAAYQLEPCRQLSTFPQFPETAVDGRAYYIAHLSDANSETRRTLVADVVEERCDLDRWLSGLPEGTMDEDGYCTFYAKAVRLLPVTDRALRPHGTSADRTNNAFAEEPPTRQSSMHAEDGSVWRTHSDAEHAQEGSFPRTLAIYLGKQEPFVSAGLSQRKSRPQISNDESLDWKEHYALARRQLPEIALLVQEHLPGKFHRVSYLKIGDYWNDTMEGCSMMTISVGGPDMR